MLQKRITDKRIPTPVTTGKNWSLRSVSSDERSLYFLVAVFFIAAFVMAYFLQITLISLLAISRFFVLLGSVGFGIAYLLRKRLKLGLLDGFFYNFFGVAPTLTAMLLFVNSLGTELQTETHRIDRRHPDSNEHGFVLENEAYHEFWRIRNYNTVNEGTESAWVEYTFSEGLLGYKVLRHAKFK